jgi:hypothetical protein
MSRRRYLPLGAYSARYTTDIGWLATPKDFVASSASRCIIGGHGRGGNGFSYGQYPLLGHVNALVDAGYVVFGVDHARINSWGDPDSARAIDDAYTYVTSTLGISNTKIGLMGWSMGGTTVINWAKRNVAKTACVWAWNPATDLRWFAEASGSYTPTYSSSPATGQGEATRASELTGAYAVSTTASGAYTIPASTDPTGITITHAALTIGNYFADGNNSANVGKPLATVNGVAFTYESRTGTTLVGCRSTTGSTISVTNGMAITATYAQQSAAYQPWNEAAYIGGLGLPIKIAQASDDTTVPPGMNGSGATGFVGRAANANVTLRTMTGGHTGGVAPANVPASEVVSFYQTHLPLG